MFNDSENLCQNFVGIETIIYIASAFDIFQTPFKYTYLYKEFLKLKILLMYIHLAILKAKVYSKLI